jgi:hypothetical protein
MAIRTKEELLTMIRDNVPESDTLVTIIEDVSDTIDDYESKTDGEDWKKRYEENDNEWREKYISRFFNPDMTEAKPVEPVEETGKIDDVKTYDDLFEVEE